MGNTPFFNSSAGTFTPDELIAGDAKIEAREGTILSGQNVLRGTVLGKITASGKYVKSLSASVDGSQVPNAILLEDVDATSADKVGAVALSGTFNENSLILGTAHTVASIRDALRDVNIYTRASIAR
jgi:hypothetical protein